MALRLRRGTNLQRLDFTPEQGELIYVTDYDTASVSPLWIGDGTTVGGVEVSSSGGGGITDVSSDTTPELGGNLSLAGFEINGTGDIDITGDITAVGNVYANNIVGDLTGAVTGNVSGNVTGNLTGNAAGNHTGFFTGEINATGAFDGDITGSVFADDSTLLIDGVGQLVKGAFLNNAIDLQEGAFKINYPTTGSDPYVDIQVIGNNNKRVDTTFVRKLVGGNIGDSDLLYQEVIVRDDDIGFQREWTTFVNSNAYIINKGNTYSPANSVAILDGQVGIGTFAPNAELEVNGSIIATSGILGDLKGSVAADDSTILVDSVSGSINIANTNIGAFNVTSPQAGQVLKWNGSEWTNAADNSGGGGAGGSAFTNIGIGADDSVLRLIEEGESFLILGGAGISTASDTEGNITITGFDGAFSSLTGKPTTIAGYGITDAFDGAFGSLTGTPTTLAGYGITDAATSAQGALADTAIQPADLGSLTFTASVLDTSDSSEITFTPAVRFSSDINVENDLVVTNKIVANTIEVENIITNASGTPEIASDTDIILAAGTRVEVSSSPLKMASYTTSDRGNISAENGDVIYNTTAGKFQGYANGVWVDLH